MGQALVPFYFVFAPSILLMPWLLDRTQPFPFVGLIGALITLCFGILSLSCAIAGYFLTHFVWYERLLFLAAAFGFLFPEFWSSVVAFVLFIFGFLLQKSHKAKQQQPAQS